MWRYSSLISFSKMVSYHSWMHFRSSNRQFNEVGYCWIWFGHVSLSVFPSVHHFGPGICQQLPARLLLNWLMISEPLNFCLAPPSGQNIPFINAYSHIQDRAEIQYYFFIDLQWNHIVKMMIISFIKFCGPNEWLQANCHNKLTKVYSCFVGFHMSHDMSKQIFWWYWF